MGCNFTKQDWGIIKISGKIEIDDISEIIFYPLESAADDYSNLHEIMLKDNGSFNFDYALDKLVNAIFFYWAAAIHAFFRYKK